MVQVLAYVCAYVFIVNSIQECLGGPTDPSLRIPVEKPMSSRAQGDSDQRSPHQKEAHRAGQGEEREGLNEGILGSRLFHQQA